MLETDGCTAVKVPVPIDVNQSAKFCAASAIVQKVFDRVTEEARPSLSSSAHPCWDVGLMESEAYASHRVLECCK